MEQNKKKKFIFISPFERYKRVIPVVAEQEEQERQKQEEEEEKKLNKLKIDDTSSTTSKTAQKSLPNQATSDQSSSRRKNKIFSISLPGRKRKRDLSLRDSSDERSGSNLSTPVPSLNKKIMQSVNKELYMTTDTTNEQNKQITVQTVSYNPNLEDDTIKPLRY